MHVLDTDRVVAGGDDRFAVAGASQLRAFLYDALWVSPSSTAGSRSSRSVEPSMAGVV